MTITPRPTFRIHPDVATTAARRFARDHDAGAARAATAGLDMQALTTRDVIARMIDPQADYATIVAKAVEGTGFRPHKRDRARTYKGLCALGRLVGLHRATEQDTEHAIALFRAARRIVPVNDWFGSERRSFAQLLWIHGEHEVLRRDPELVSSLPGESKEFLQIDLEGSNTGVGSATWMALVNHYLVRHGVSPISLAATGATAFDCLQPAERRSAEPGPLITVVMPAYRPGPEIATAVRSIIDQTWASWELLVVDDASGSEFDATFHEIETMDPRVRVVRQPVNRGTYAARNRALSEANGEYITFQDIDDWSHPERLERQVQPLLDDPALIRTLSLSIRGTDDLVFQYLGFLPVRSNASSHLFRRSVLESVGRFDWVRKSADTEFDRRLEAAFPGGKLQLREPLAFIRLQSESLSRGDFQPGWMHPFRVEYRASMLHWHQQIESGASPEVPVDVARRPLTAPRPFLRGFGLPEQSIDVAFVADWTMDLATQRAGLDEMLALSKAGLRVGLIHSRSIFSAAKPRAALSVAARRALASGAVTFVSLEESDHIPTLVVRQPDILEFPASRPVALTTDQVVIVADSAPDVDEPGRPRWNAADCDHNARALFGVEPSWTVRDHGVAATIAGTVSGERIAASTHPVVLHQSVPSTPAPRRFRGVRPVIGWVCGDGRGNLPGSPETMRRVYPNDDSVDVRLLGGGTYLNDALDGIPPNWLVFAEGQISARELAHQVDFLVGFPPSGPTTESLRTATEGLASGCVVLLSKDFAPHFGDAAVYCEPDDAPEMITRLRKDAETFRAQSLRGQRWAAMNQDGSVQRLMTCLGVATAVDPLPTTPL